MPHGDMNSGLHQLVISALISTFNMKQSGDWLRQGTCPSCNKKELYAHSVNPVLVRCGRLNNCGYEEHVRNVLPDLFVDFNRKYPARDENPNATANAYMELVRGLNPVKLKGNWTQGTYFNPNANKATATVKFTLPEGQAMERFVETVTIRKDDGTTDDRKMHFTGKYLGQWWMPKGMEIKEGDTVWIVEGCIDALSLNEVGIKAVAVLSAYNFPQSRIEELKGKKIDWVWAFDNDTAGRKRTRKFHERLEDMGENSRAAMPPAGARKIDWNDMFVQNRLDETEIRNCYYRGSLVIAKNPSERGLLMWHKRGINSFDFTFNNRTYWFKLDYEKYTTAYSHLTEKEGYTPNARETQEKAAQMAGSVMEIANCKVTFLYFLANELTDEAWYYARVEFPHSGRPVKNTFTGAAVASASEFKKRLLSIAAGAVFTGQASHLDHIIRERLYDLKTVQTIDYLGYSKEHEAYIYNDHAVSDGKVYKLNDEDFFEIGKTNIKSLLKSPSLEIGKPGDYDESWKEHFWNAFGHKGAIALAFWMGSFFAEQIRAKHGFYPFLEIVGQAGAGKSTLIEFLWKLTGRPGEEGFDPAKSTAAARARKLSQVSNLPVVLIESDRDDDDSAKQKSFDWDEFKTAFNGRPTRSRGMKNNGNDTYDPPFRGALVISQNAKVSASEAIMTRIIHMTFTRAGHTLPGKEAADAINTMPVERVSQFLIKTISQEKAILDRFFRAYDHYVKVMLEKGKIQNHRISNTHAQMMAMADMAGKSLNLSKQQIEEIHHELIAMATEREQSVSTDCKAVEEFWECFEFLEAAGAKPNHSNSEKRIAINLNHFIQMATERRQNLPDKVDLKRHLRTSKKHAFLGIDKIRSSVWSEKTVSCWIFDAKDKKP